MSKLSTIPQIVDLDESDMHRLLTRVNFGHLGLCRDDRPYVIPIHFAYDREYIYFYTTEGLKTDIIESNPTVCLQVEEIASRERWESVVVTGAAERMKTSEEIERAMKLIKQINPKLSPAWSVRWLDNWVRSNHDAVYRIRAADMTGRRAYKETRDPSAPDILES